ncbi:MAG: RNA polymerase sigma factor [Planctomycetes bacterium]|nr:RNA polymerase sigma factor [Planctomycetota bacterium]
MGPSSTVPAFAGTSAALERLAMDQDADAWGLIVENHGKDMFRAAYRVTGDDELAGDACQEAFLHIRAGAARFKPLGEDPDAAARAWIMRVTVTSALQLLRARRRRSHHETAVARRAPVASDTTQPESEAPAPAVVEALRRELTDLPESHRLPLLLHVHAGLDYRAIAGEVGCSEGNARVRVHRALTRLRKRLAGVGVALSLSAIQGSLSAAESMPGPALAAQWKALLVSTQVPIVPATVVFGGGWSLMAKVALTAAIIAAPIAGTVAIQAQRQTIEPEVAQTIAPAVPPLATAVETPPTPGVPTSGVAVGVVSSVDIRNGTFGLRDGATGAVEVYSAKWLGRQPHEGGGPDRVMLERIRRLSVGESISVRWETDERKRAMEITPAPASASP